MLLEILIIILLIIFIILYLGVRIIAEWQKSESDFEFNLRILILSKVNVYSMEYPSKEEKKDSKQEGKNSDMKPVLKTLPPAIKPVVQYLKKILKSLQFMKLENHVNLGLDSYVSTAKYVGYLWSIFIIPNSLFENASLTAEPNFDESVIDFKGECDIKINLLKIVLPTIVLIKNKDVRKLIKTFREGRKDGNTQ